MRAYVKGLPGSIWGYKHVRGEKQDMVNPVDLSAVLEHTSVPLETSVVRNNYTKLLRKRDTYVSYFNKNLPLVDLALKKVLIKSSIRVTRPSAIFGEYDKYSKTCRLIGKSPSKVQVDKKVLKERPGKEKETLKKYARRVLEKAEQRRKKYDAAARTKKFLRESSRWAKRYLRELEQRCVSDNIEVLRAAARALGAENDPVVRSHLGNQVRPPPELNYGSWVADPQLVTRVEVEVAVRNLGIQSVLYRPPPMIDSGPSRRRTGVTRTARCDSCQRDQGTQPGYCDHCHARLRVFRRR